MRVNRSLNPLKRVNSILTDELEKEINEERECVSIPSSGSIQFLQYLFVSIANGLLKSQSPQAGQFNSYENTLKENEMNLGLNPLKRVNSILTRTYM